MRRVKNIENIKNVGIDCKKPKAFDYLEHCRKKDKNVSEKFKEYEHEKK